MSGPRIKSMSAARTKLLRAARKRLVQAAQKACRERAIGLSEPRRRPVTWAFGWSVICNQSCKAGSSGNHTNRSQARSLQAAAGLPTFCVSLDMLLAMGSHLHVTC